MLSSRVWIRINRSQDHFYIGFPVDDSCPTGSPPFFTPVSAFLSRCMHVWGLWYKLYTDFLLPSHKVVKAHTENQWSSSWQINWTGNELGEDNTTHTWSACQLHYSSPANRRKGNEKNPIFCFTVIKITAHTQQRVWHEMTLVPDTHTPMLAFLFHKLLEP